MKNMYSQHHVSKLHKYARRNNKSAKKPGLTKWQSKWNTSAKTVSSHGIFKMPKYFPDKPRRF